MSVDTTIERLVERGQALLAWEGAGGSVGRLVALDRVVRHGQLTDWPGRDPGPEPRQGIPDIDLAEYERRVRGDGR